MAKPIIGYATVRGSNFSGDIEVIAITSETGRRTYGRDRYGDPTNRARRDVLGRFEDQASADAAVRRATDVRSRLSPAVRHAEQKALRLREELRLAIAHAATPEGAA